MSEKHILRGPEGAVLEKQYQSFGDVMIDSLKEHADETLQICALTDKITTGREILEKVCRLTSVLHAAGIRSGDSVSICSENRVDFTIVAISALCAGAAVAPTNITYSPDELKHAYGLSKPKIVFASPYLIYNILEIVLQCPYIKYLVIFGEEDPEEANVIAMETFQMKFHTSKSINIEQFKATPVDVRNHTAAILCSSGTTGLPKGVELTHHNLITSLANWLARIDEVTEAIRVLAIIPWFHAFGFVTALTLTAFGGTMVVLPRFDEVLFLESIQKHKITYLFTVPPLLVFLTKHPLVANYDLSSIKRIMCGAAPLSKELQNSVTNRFNAPVLQGYGLTETTLAVLVQTPESSKYGSCGVLSPGTSAKVIDVKTGKALGPNKRGELCFKGDLMMKGYIGDPGATAGILDKEGWLHTGDVGYYDEDGHFFIVDRLKELIKYKGYQVPPAELEALLLTHPNVMDCAVIGIPDERAGELPLAFIVPRPENKPTKQQIIDFVAERVSYAKRLHGGVEFTDEIPKNPTGKILRRILRDQVIKPKSKL